jgi:hypothetical protein
MRGGSNAAAFVGRHLRGANIHRSGSTALLDAPAVEQLNDRAAAVSETLGCTLDRFSGLVTLDKIVKVEVSRYAGHVYDLQTETGVTMANDIITSNCRCDLAPVIDRE